MSLNIADPAENALAESKVVKKLSDMQGKAVLVASHPRSGTHLLIDLLRRQFPVCHSWRWWGQPLDYLYLNVERLVAEKRHFDDELAVKILSRSQKPILKTHAFSSFSEWFFDNETGSLPPHWSSFLRNRGSTFYVVRDPRKVMASYHQFMRGITPKADCSLAAFMRQTHSNSSKNRLRTWANHVREWMNVPGVSIIKFEDLINHTCAVINKISAVLGEDPIWKHPFLPRNVRSNYTSRFYRMTMLSPPSTSIIANQKKWVYENWKNVLSSDERQFLHNELGDLLLKLGYENSTDWVYK